ncbi:hypothetical protein ABZ345_24655 [Lentzea sp. NPDC005914]|uniref:hypothetical protein n=1 Tax=Lentzea sp. NPDC005914 TaxID=3154572 RepID=UPI0033F26CE9
MPINLQRQRHPGPRRLPARDGTEPDWLGFYGESDLMSDIGQCLRDTGRPRQGVALPERALGTLPEHRVTARAKTQSE